MPSISLRGTTYQALKDHAVSLGMGPSPLAQEWIHEYVPFTDKVPPGIELPVQAEEVPVASVASVEPVPPMVTAVAAPQEQPAPEPPQPPKPVEAKMHPEVPLDPPERDEPKRTKPFVTHAGDPTLKPPTPRAPDGGGVITF